MSLTLSRYGLHLAVPDGWEARIYRRAPQDPGELSYPVLHLGTVALPPVRGDYGGGVVEHLGSEDVFIAMLELGDAVADEGLFARRGIPRLKPSQFGPGRLPHVQADVSAVQHLFCDARRAFCLYVVVGSHGRRMATVPRAEAALRGLTIRPALTARSTGALT
jgi:hypothetical protein